MDEHRRQKKLERKRRRREDKRKAAAVLLSPLWQRLGEPPPWPTPALAPAPKMSDTLVAFAKDELDCLPDEATAAQLEGLLLIAMAVWNAVVIGPASSLEARLWELSRKLQPPPSISQEQLFGSLRALAERKRRLFAHDRRIVVNVAVVNKGGQLRIVAMSAPGPS